MVDPRQAVLDEIADLSRGDLEAVLAYYTDDVYFEDVTVPQPCRNKSEMRDFMAIFYRGFPDLHIDVRSCVACDGGTVVAEYDLMGTHTGEFVGHQPTGRSFRIKAVSVYEHDGDLFTRESVYYDSASLFGQLGLPVGGA
jgi:steroid delta-isomerase-like uncharacterized protein